MSERYLIFVKQDCPTCELIKPVLHKLLKLNVAFNLYVQDFPENFKNLPTIDDTKLKDSYRNKIEIVPTVLKVSNGSEIKRIVGWSAEEWAELFGSQDIAVGMPELRPGCGSLSVEDRNLERLTIQFGDKKFASKLHECPELLDDVELCYENMWTDGLPVVPPTRERVYRMLQGTHRNSLEVVGIMPPNNIECSIEKIAINAVMAGCKPEYLPVVISAVEASLEPAFCLQGLVATTWLSGPMIIVNGPVINKIGMNFRGNVLGQGNRPNSTIGRALQLIIRNVGGGLPQEVDQATFGTPSKVGFCFAENEETPWQNLSQERGIPDGSSCLTLFSADGPIGCVDQTSRCPEKLLVSIAGSLKIINHFAMTGASDAVVVIGPEHGRVFDNANWSKEDVKKALHEVCVVQTATNLGMTTGGLSGTDDKEHQPGHAAPKFRPEGLTLIRAGGDAGLFSAIIPGWLMNGELGTEPVTKEIEECNFI